MTTIDHPLFGCVDVGVPGTWAGTHAFAGHDVSVDLTLDEPSSDPAAVHACLSSLDELSVHDRVARVAMEEEGNDGEDTASGLYMTHHRGELTPEEWTQVFGAIDPKDIDAGTFVAQLRLARVGLYPGDEDRCLLFDYTLPGDVTDYVLSVSFSADGQLVGIDMES